MTETLFQYLDNRLTVRSRQQPLELAHSPKCCPVTETLFENQIKMVIIYLVGILLILTYFINANHQSQYIQGRILLISINVIF